MSYETKLYVVSEEFSTYAEILATIDLSCCPLPGLFKSEAKRKIYIMESDTGDEIIKDKYDEPIKCEKAENVIKALRKIPNYWRAEVGADLISDIMEKCNTREKLMVYKYGH